jgi:hypothetical protein
MLLLAVGVMGVGPNTAKTISKTQVKKRARKKTFSLRSASKNILARGYVKGYGNLL